MNWHPYSNNELPEDWYERKWDSKYKALQDYLLEHYAHDVRPLDSHEDAFAWQDKAVFTISFISEKSEPFFYTYRTALIRKIFVLPTHRKQGVQESLLTALITGSEALETPLIAVCDPFLALHEERIVTVEDAERETEEHEHVKLEWDRKPQRQRFQRLGFQRFYDHCTLSMDENHCANNTVIYVPQSLPESSGLHQRITRQIDWLAERIRQQEALIAKQAR